MVAQGDSDIRGRSFSFAARVVRLCKNLEARPGVNRALAMQLVRSGTSIGANVEEAYGGHSRADFIAKMVIAAKEARESRYWLRLLMETGILPQARLESLLDEAGQIVAILTRIIITSRARTKISGR